MKRWFFLGMVTVLSIVALIAAMSLTTAQFSKMTPVAGNIMGMGNIKLAGCDPNPLITCNNMMPGETRDFFVYLTPNGTINQDIYIGLADQPGWPDDNLVSSGYVNVAWDVGNDGWDVGYSDISTLFASYQPLALNQISGGTITVKVSIQVKKTMPNEFMDKAANFYVLIDAVQAGGDAPTTAPYLWTP